MFFYIFQLCKKLMALPLLPHQHVVQVFETITANLDDQVPAITELVNYVRATWVESRAFPPAGWSVFGQAVRTNNICIYV